MLSLALVLALAAVVLALNKTNYCKRYMCSPGTTHIACKNKGKFATTCPKGARLVDLTPFIDSILISHNTKRNLIASGGLKGYPAAAQMATMGWDSDLALMAEYKVKKCFMKHNECRSTKTYQYSGQNLGSYGYSGPESGYNDITLIHRHIEKWWSEHEDCKEEYIRGYPRNYTGPAIGHFTLMVIADNMAVGCAVSRYMEEEYNRFMMACNYATINFFDRPVYQYGHHAAACETGANEEYSSLCSIDEKYYGL